MTAYYNEFDPYAAQWLRNLIDAGHIAPGIVDERSIEDVTPADLAGFTQCHFFAGIGVWSLALRKSGWPDDRPVWTGSCPCQPFSAAGTGAGFADSRHLWPSFAWLIRQCQPAVVFGEQVASKAVEPWVDLVHADLEAMGYAFGAIPFPSAGVGAPHIRDRLFWVADAQSDRHEWAGQLDESTRRDGAAHLRAVGRMANADGRDSSAEREQCGGEQRQQSQDGSGLPRVANPKSCGRGEERTNPGGGSVGDSAQGRAARFEHGVGNLRMADTSSRELDGFDPLLQWEKSRRIEGASLETAGRGAVNGFWRGADWISCRDDRWRPVEPGTFPLAHGAPDRVGRLRAYGNAINAEAAHEFIAAYMA